MTVVTLACLLLIPLGSFANYPVKYRLVWKDDFRGHDIDWARWEKIPRGQSPWNKYMSPYDSCYSVAKGKLILRAIHNTCLPQDTASYLTGGIRTRDGFLPGKIEIRASLGEARGFWPAFWMLPTWHKTNAAHYKQDKSEIDIMEHLNHDDIAYQTVHSHYTLDLKHDTLPPHYATGKIRQGNYNVYAVEIFPDSLVFSINGRHTFTYPRLPQQEKNLQFEFHKSPFYLMIDTQLGGSWVGPVDPADIPVDIKVDWVKYYVRKK